jgi:hypothetical protein
MVESATRDKNIASAAGNVKDCGEAQALRSREKMN